MLATESHLAASEELALRQLGTGQKTLGCLPPGGALVCRGGLLSWWGCGGGGGSGGGIAVVVVLFGSAAELLADAPTHPSRRGRC